MTGATNSAIRPPAALQVPSLGAKLFGLGSIFGKTFRDSFRAALGLGIVMVVLMVVTAVTIAAEFDTVAKRQAIATQMAALPEIFRGMLGEMVGIERLGGFLSWRTVNFLPIILGIWSLVAMGGLLAGELARGSLDLLATSPRRRARIALEKVAGFVAALALAVAMFGVGSYVAVNAFGTLPEDALGADAVAGHAVWLLLVALVPGALAFAAGPFLGRGGALAVGGLALFGSFIVNAYSSTIAALDSLTPLSYFSITNGHRPMAGISDWPAVAVVAAATVAVIGVGVVAFARRDLLTPSGGRLRIPTGDAFLTGPLTRALGERLPAALVWGGGLALFGLIVSISVDEFVATIASIPQFVAIIQQFFPDADILSAAGFLQLAFFSEAILFISIAAATLVGGWASDEGDRRLELLLAAPVSRAGWATRSAIAVMAGIVVMTVLLVAGVAVGASTQSAAGDVGSLAVGVSVLGLYAMALAGIGLAIGGLIRPGWAAPVTLTVALTFFLWDVIGTIVGFPDELLDLSLSRHLGEPILGRFDWPGMAACAVLAIGGIVLCALGMRRRDIGR